MQTMRLLDSKQCSRNQGQGHMTSRSRKFWHQFIVYEQVHFCK